MTEAKKIEIVYAGRVLNNGTIQYSYFELNHTDNRLLFSKKIVKLAIIGSIIECENVDSDTYRNFQLSGRVDSEQQSELFVKSRISEDQIVSHRDATKAPDDEIKRIASDIARSLKKLTVFQRNSFWNILKEEATKESYK